MPSTEPSLAPRRSRLAEGSRRLPATLHRLGANARTLEGTGGLVAREEGARPASSPGAASEASTRDAEGRHDRRRRFHCRVCDTHVADHVDLFAAAGADAPGFFVNPAGRFFEVLTLRRARSIAVAGNPTLEATWFEGYAWQFALCARCTTHLGWRYVSSAGAEPTSFYGLIRDALVERDDHAPLRQPLLSRSRPRVGRIELAVYVIAMVDHRSLTARSNVISPNAPGANRFR